MAGVAVGFEPVSSVDSLLTGNFTGKFAIPDPKMPILEQETAAPQRLLEQFPKQKTGKKFARTGNICQWNREIKAHDVFAVCSNGRI